MPLAGCGFHLRGAPTIPPEMATTYIATNDRHSPFYRELRRELLAAGVDVVDSPTSASAVFSILFDETDQRVLSVSARNVPREYEVYYTVGYSVQSGENLLLLPQEQTVTRDYTYDELLVLGKAREEELLRDSIVDDLVRVVLIQLSSL
ncbi:MAG: LPS assembly lipoprotein LptE [Woeseia sp.]